MQYSPTASLSTIYNSSPTVGSGYSSIAPLPADATRPIPTAGGPVASGVRSTPQAAAAAPAATRVAEAIPQNPAPAPRAATQAIPAQPSPPQPAAVQPAPTQPVPASPPAAIPPIDAQPIPSAIESIPAMTPPAFEDGEDDIPSNPGDFTSQWTPWPLPEPAPQTTAAASPFDSAPVTGKILRARNRHRHLSVATRPGSHAERISREEAILTTAAAASDFDEEVTTADLTVTVEDNSFFNSNEVTSKSDLKFRGGKTLPTLGYVNLYVAGDQGWNLDEVMKIDQSIAAAMQDDHLNNIVRQYFDNQPIQTIVHPSHPLTGRLPSRLSRGDLHHMLRELHARGYLSQYDLKSTVFNFLCPPGTVLTDHDVTTVPGQVSSQPRNLDPQDFSENEEPEYDSRNGLAGYHGSIHIGDETLYYSTVVYSEQRQDGFKNGIPAFSENWKNVVAMLYHQLQEVRTNPDVEDVIRNPNDPAISAKLGWTSDAGEEFGDSALLNTVSIRTVMQEVPLADGSGTVPVQIGYSNATHGPEGPVDELYPASPRE